jgi:amidase
MANDELAYMSAAAITDHVRRRVLSPVEIVDACIARIERRDPSLNAFVFKGFEDTRRADADVLAAAAAFERGKPWQGHYALCEGRMV